MTDVAARLHAFFRRRETALWMLLIVAVAAALRFAGLTVQSYGYEELSSAWYSNPAHSYLQLRELASTDWYPPLHELAMWWSYRYFGYTEFAGRLPAALAGVMTIPVIFLLGGELFDRRTGLYAAALAVPNYSLVYYAQDARPYALLCLLACLSCWFLLRALRRAGVPDLFLYVVTTVAALYTHSSAFLLLSAQLGIFLAYWLLWVDRTPRLLIRMAVAGGVVLAASIPLLLVKGQPAGSGGEEIVQTPLAAAAGYFGSPVLAAAVALLIAAALLAAATRPVREHRRSWPVFSVVALLLWSVPGLLLPWLWGLMARPALAEPGSILLLPPLLILAASGLRSLPSIVLQRLAGVLLLGFSFYHLMIASQYYRRIEKDQYREIAAALTAYPVSLPVYALTDNATRYNVYFEQGPSHLRAVDYRALEQKLAAASAEALFWLVDGHRHVPDTDIEERFGLVQVARYDFRGTVAELLLNPRSATPVTLEQSILAAGSGTTWFSAQPFGWKRGNAQLLLALNPAARSDPARKVQLDILDVQGHVLESHSAVLGPIPSTLQLSPQLEAGDQARLVVRMPDGEPEPEVWIISNRPATH